MTVRARKSLGTPIGVSVPNGRATTRTRPDALLVAVGLLTLTSIWRIHALFPILTALQLPSLAALGSYALVITNRSARRRAAVLRHPIAIAAILLLCFAGVSAIGGILTTRTVFFITGDFSKTVLMMVVVVLAVRSLKDLEWMIATQVFGATLYASSIMMRYSVESSGRLGGLIYYDSNDLAMLLVMALPMGVYFLRGGSSRSQRLVALAAFGVILVGLVKTGSRGGFLAFIAVLAFMLFRFSALSRRARFGAVVALTAGLLLVGNQQYWAMMGTLLNPSEDYNFAGQSETGRVEIWKRGLGYMMAYPLTGVGAANFGVAEGRLSERAKERLSRGAGTKESAPHNSFVMAGAEMGIPGLTCFVALIVLAFTALRSVTTARRRGHAKTSASIAVSQALTGTMLAYVIAGGLFLSQTYNSLLFTVFGLIVALRSLDAPEPSLPPSPGRSTRRAQRANNPIAQNADFGFRRLA